MLENITPLMETVFSIVIFIFSYLKFKDDGDEFTKSWAIAFLMYGLGNLMGLLILTNIVTFTSKLNFIVFQFTRQTLINGFFTILLYNLVKQVTLERDWKRKIPFGVFLVTQALLLYFDIQGLGTVGEIIHMIILDIPFNLAIGSLFLFMFFQKKNKFDLINGIAWLSYIILIIVNQNIRSVFDYRYLIYSLSTLPIIMISISMFYLYYNHENRKILDLSNLFLNYVEKDLRLILEKFKIKKGELTFIDKKSNDENIIMESFANENIPMLIITRQNPEYLKNNINFGNSVKILWVTKIRTQKEKINPDDLEKIVYTVKNFIKQSISNNKSGVIVIDCIESLKLNSTFLKVIHSLQMIHDFSYKSKVSVIIPIVKNVFNEQEIGIIEEEFSSD